jgi:hypothetical protein
MGGLIALTRKGYMYRICLGNLRKTDHLEDLDVDGVKIKWFLKKLDRKL